MFHNYIKIIKNKSMYTVSEGVYNETLKFIHWRYDWLCSGPICYSETDPDPHLEGPAQVGR